MLFGIALVRIAAAFCLPVAGFLPWLQLDDTTIANNGLDLAVYGFTGPDKLLFLRQNIIMALGMFVVPVFILIMTTHISGITIVDVLRSKERTALYNVSKFAKISIPVVLLLYFARPFIDDDSYSIYMFAMPHFGLLLVICAAFFLLAIEVFSDHILHKISEADYENDEDK